MILNWGLIHSFDFLELGINQTLGGCRAVGSQTFQFVSFRANSKLAHILKYLFGPVSQWKTTRFSFIYVKFRACFECSLSEGGCLIFLGLRSLCRNCLYQHGSEREEYVPPALHAQSHFPEGHSTGRRLSVYVGCRGERQSVPFSSSTHSSLSCSWKSGMTSSLGGIFWRQLCLFTVVSQHSEASWETRSLHSQYDNTEIYGLSLNSEQPVGPGRDGRLDSMVVLYLLGLFFWERRGSMTDTVRCFTYILMALFQGRYYHSYFLEIKEHLGMHS